MITIHAVILSEACAARVVEGSALSTNRAQRNLIKDFSPEG
jgi:hypothetical protein